MTAKRSEGSRSSEPQDLERQVQADIASAREECLTNLRAIATNVQQLLNQTTADVTRALAENQTSVQMRQQALVLDYMDKMKRASATSGCAEEIAEFSKSCADDLQLSIEEAQKSFNETREKANATVNAGISKANQEWEKTCLEFVGALRQRMAKIQPVTTNAAYLAQIGQALAWIASLMHRPKEA